jgi:2-keto-4-pentenoate hydratase
VLSGGAAVIKNIDVALRPMCLRPTPNMVDEALAAVASLRSAFEQPDSRFADFARAGQAQLIADNACCGRFAYGAASPSSLRRADLAAHRVHAVVVQGGGAQGGQLCYRRDGEGRALLGNPLTADYGDFRCIDIKLA